MICPCCNETLRLAERAGVKIDYCPTCRGIWLDRVELDKLIAIESSNMQHRRSLDCDSDWSKRDLTGASPEKKESFWRKMLEFE